MADPHRLSVGRAPFRLFPAYLLDDDGTVHVSDLCHYLQEASIVVTLALNGDGELVLSETERSALASMTRCISDAFESLADLFIDAAERPVVIEPAEPATQRGRRSTPNSVGVPDLTVPADPPRAAHG